jgi:uncharacterized membrane protein
VIPFYVMLAGILIARLLGVVWPALDDWRMATRAGLAIMFVFTGLAHFGRTRHDLVRMRPPQLPNPSALVTLTGVAELAGGPWPRHSISRPLGGVGLMVLLVAMFPANIYAARIGHTIDGRPHTRMALRLPLQVLWIGMLWRSADADFIWFHI